MNCLLPRGWNAKDYDYNSNTNNSFGGVIKTGRENNITVLDCDTEESYEILCKLYPKLHLHYTVKTRRGYHIYFKYDARLKSIDIDKIDLQNDNKLVIAQDTPVERYDGAVYKYIFLGGSILEMPDVIVKKCKMHNDQHEEFDFT
eukprot:scaffold2878_cov239-Ochromonas_danica.AAC.1